MEINVGWQLAFKVGGEVMYCGHYATHNEAFCAVGMHVAPWIWVGEDICLNSAFVEWIKPVKIGKEESHT